jgi:GT2 family glycosyltransferase
MTRVVALLACHNRRDRTVRCLESLFAQEVEGVELGAVLVDDGSTDGTSDAIRSRFEGVEIIRGDGSLYWARSMALAEKHAAAQRPEFLLWLNDDVVLYPDAVRTLVAAEDAVRDPRIVAGYTVDPMTGVPNYGGASRVDWHPLRFRLVIPTDARPMSSDTFNGNVVLVPRAISQAVGGIDGHFAHAFADLDYGLRARALGFEVVVAGPAVGECRREFGPARWRDASLPLLARYRLMLSRKGVPISSSSRYMRRHGNKLWPVYVAATYAKVAADHVHARTVARGRPTDWVGASSASAGPDGPEQARESLVRGHHALEQSDSDL